jgi:hypothetical protein
MWLNDVNKTFAAAVFPGNVVNYLSWPEVRVHPGRSAVGAGE